MAKLSKLGVAAAALAAAVYFVSRLGEPSRAGQLELPMEPLVLEYERLPAELDPLRDDGGALAPERAEAQAPSDTATAASGLNAGEAISGGPIEVARGGDVSGRIIDARGRPIARALVVLERFDVPQSELVTRDESELRAGDRPHTESRDDGTFTLRGLPVGMQRLAAGGVGFRTTFSAPFEVRAAYESRGVELVLEPIPRSKSISGVVVDPDGAVVAFAKVQHSYRTSSAGGSGSLGCDSHGRFHFVPRRGAAQDLIASDDKSRWGPVELEDVEPGTHDIVLKLVPRVELVVRARTRSGALIERFNVTAADSESRAFGGMSGEGPHADGAARFVPTVARFVLKVDAPGYALGHAGPFEAVPAEPVEVVLDPLPGIRGHVTHAGAGVAGALIEVHRRREGQTYEVNGLPARFDLHSLDQTESASDGSYELTLRQAADVTLLVIADGFADAELELDDFEPSVGRVGADVKLVRGGSIEGRVLVERGCDPAGTIVAFSRGDGRAFTQRVGSEGAYRASGLTPGKWEVRAVDAEISASSTRSGLEPGSGAAQLPWNCEVFDGRTTHFDLELGGAREQAELAVHVRVDGAPAFGWLLELHIGAGRSEGGSAKANLDREGRGRVATQASGSATAVLTAIGGDLDGLRYVRRLTLAPGLEELALELRSARVRIENATVEPRLLVVWLGGADGEYAVRPVQTAGSSELHMLAGPLKLWRYEKSAVEGDPRSWPALDSATAEPGGSVALDAAK